MNNSNQTGTENEVNTDSIGNMSREQFDVANENAAQTVAAVNPTIESFSESDWQLLLQVAVGGTMQLELSRVAADMATDEEVLALAKAEVEEQTGLSDKLKEFADTKNLTLPSKPDEKTQEMVKHLQNLAGAEFDLAYVRASGVMGHEKLDAVMSKVEAEAADPDLLNLAAAAHPLVLVHLQVSSAILERISA